jgi:methyl coenzyme M reductase subunit C-like uncharacterized protein (methanogenesis marker protein 7)
LGQFTEQKTSDIVRTIVRISKEDRREKREFKLFIYSDMIENSDFFSPKYLFEYTIERLIYGIKQYQQVAALDGANVSVAGVGRADSRDRRPLTIKEKNKLVEFWGAYFTLSGTKAFTITQGSFQ